MFIKKLLRRFVPKSVAGWIAYRLPTRTVTYSQYAEDVLLKKILAQTKGFYVDIGAFHPKFGSNTHRLWKQGWRGINIDVDDYKIAQFRRFRPHDINLTLGVSSEETKRTFYIQETDSYGSMSSFEKEFATDRSEALNRRVVSREVQVCQLNTLLDKHLPRNDDGSLTDIDLLCIDVEGHEYEILRTFDFHRYRPACVCVEIHAHRIADLIETTTFQLLEMNGYQMVAWPAPSCIFSRISEKEGSPTTVQHDSLSATDYDQLPYKLKIMSSAPTKASSVPSPSSS
ncbi:MAG: FkbM family methyltransferase [Aeoliella sp.]